jgi:septum formation protein
MSASRAELPRLILASASPRRRELLARLGLAFEVRPVDADETPRPGEPPEALVLRLALAKARAAARAGELALGADTVVAIEHEVLGKPVDAEDARRMLRALSGRPHDVWTGVALVAAGPAGASREQVHAERTAVTFRRLTEDEIAAYVESREPLDKAGAYAIQGGAAAFVERVDGDYDNVVGLPLAALRRLLDERRTTD